MSDSSFADDLPLKDDNGITANARADQKDYKEAA